jgi:hypothetical protein
MTQPTSKRLLTESVSTKFKSVSDGGYLIACFRGDSGNLGGDQQLSVLYSTDGATFIDPAYAPVYTPNQTTYPNKVVRDPSIIYLGCVKDVRQRVGFLEVRRWPEAGCRWS